MLPILKKLFRVPLLFVGLLGCLLRKKIKVDDTEISYSIPYKFFIPPLVYRRYKATKKKEEDTFYWLNYCSKLSPEWNAFIDIGCNVGVFSILARTLLPYTKIYAFDPLFHNCITTYLFLKANNFVASEEIVQQAYLSDSSHIEMLFNSIGTPGITAGTAKERNNKSQQLVDRGFSVPLSVFSIIEEDDNVKRNIVKIDVDGPEYDVLRGFSSNQLKSVGAISVEIDAADIKSAKGIHDLLISHGLIPSSNNIVALDGFIEVLPEGKYKSNIIELYSCLKDKNNFDDGMASILGKQNYYLKRARMVVNNQANFSGPPRYALNWFYYSKSICSNVDLDSKE